MHSPATKRVILSSTDERRLDRALFGGGFGLVFGPLREEKLRKLMKVKYKVHCFVGCVFLFLQFVVVAVAAVDVAWA